MRDSDTPLGLTIAVYRTRFCKIDRIWIQLKNKAYEGWRNEKS